MSRTVRLLPFSSIGVSAAWWGKFVGVEPPSVVNLGDESVYVSVFVNVSKLSFLEENWSKSEINNFVGVLLSENMMPASGLGITTGCSEEEGGVLW